MLTRRHLRIKVLQTLYSFYQDGEGDAGKAEKELFFSIDKMEEMYVYLLQMVVEMQGAAIDKLSKEGINNFRRRKIYIPTPNL